MNYPFFFSGLLSILFAVIHIMLGEKFVFIELKNHPIPNNIHGKIYTTWMQVTAGFLVVGTALIFLSFYPHYNHKDFAAVFILALLILNFLIFVSVLFARQREKVVGSTPQILLYLIIIILVLMGILL